MKGEYVSIKTLRQLKKQRDNIQTSALQLDKIVKEKQQEIERLNNIINKAVIILEDYQNSLFTEEQRKTILFDTTPEIILRILKGSNNNE